LREAVHTPLRAASFDKLSLPHRPKNRYPDKKRSLRQQQHTPSTLAQISHYKRHAHRVASPKQTVVTAALLRLINT
jgi:hypothetical protein